VFYRRIKNISWKAWRSEFIYVQTKADRFYNKRKILKYGILIFEQTKGKRDNKKGGWGLFLFIY